MLVREQRRDDGDADPVERADGKSEPDRDETRDRRSVRDPRAEEHSADAEPRRDGVQPLLAVDVDVEQRVEEVEARDPERDRGAEHPRLPRELAGDRNPAPDRREPVHDPEPDVAEPGPALQVRIDDEAGDGNRPEPARDRRELPHGEEKDRERHRAEQRHLDDRQLAARNLPAGGARIARVEPRVDQPVQRHRQRPRADHRDGDPDEVVPARPRIDGEERADVRKGQREDGVLDLHEPREARRQRSECRSGRGHRRQDTFTSAGARRRARPRAARAHARAPGGAPRSRRGSRRASRGD